MKTPEQMYGKSFFGKRHKLSWRAPYVINALEIIFDLKPEHHTKYIDIGCAIGDLVAEALRRGYNSYGLEGSKEASPFLECPESRVFFLDLRRRIKSKIRFDILTCFEVAEHIEEEFSNIFVSNLCRISDIIIMSAAPPGQKGHHHFNCQPYEYWDTKFMKMNYDKIPEFENRFRNLLAPWKRKDGIRAFYNNCLIYRRRK